MPRLSCPRSTGPDVANGLLVHAKQSGNVGCGRLPLPLMEDVDCIGYGQLCSWLAVVDMMFLGGASWAIQQTCTIIWCEHNLTGSSFRLLLFAIQHQESQRFVDRPISSDAIVDTDRSPVFAIVLFHEMGSLQDLKFGHMRMLLESRTRSF